MERGPTYERERTNSRALAAFNPDKTKRMETAGRTRVKNPDRNRSGLPVTGQIGPGRFRLRPVARRFTIGPNSKFKFEFQQIKNSHKILKNTSSYDESNDVKFFQIFVHLVYFASI